MFSRAKNDNIGPFHAFTGVHGSRCLQTINLPKDRPKLNGAAGFSVVELLVVLLVIAIVTAVGLIGFQKSSRSFNLAGATRNLSGYLEKARIDSVRRHGGASVDINSTSSYTANIDFSGMGAATALTVNLPTGTTLSYTLPPATTSIDPSSTPITITYDWHGRTANTVLLTLTDSTAGVVASTVIVGSAGDLSTDSTVTGPVTGLTPENTTVTTTAGIKSMRY